MIWAAVSRSVILYIWRVAMSRLLAGAGPVQQEQF